MHHACTQHAHHFDQQRRVMLQRLLAGEEHIVQPWRSVAVNVHDQLHQQHAVVKVERLGHAHARRGEPVQRVNLGALPRGLLRLSAKLAALRHRARLSRVLDFAVLGVIHGLTKTAMGRLFVNLGAQRFVTIAHHENHRLFAAHQLADNGVDQALINQGLHSFIGFHGLYFAVSADKRVLQLASRHF